MEIQLETIINEFYQKRHSRLKECAINSLKTIRKQHLWGELISESFFYITKNKEKLRPQIEVGNIEACLVRWMDSQINWSNSHFRKLYVNSNKKMDKMTVEMEVENLELFDEDSEAEYQERQEIARQRLKPIYETLENIPVDKRILFDLVYNQGINTSGKLEKYYQENIPIEAPGRKSCYLQLVQLKTILLSGQTQNKNHR